ncbi:MAG: hypothetical protein HQ488_04940 [Parcubacteria group bacterium]|nr:hypothetical protein [Parcubacteria group bacterium]
MKVIKITVTGVNRDKVSSAPTGELEEVEEIRKDQLRVLSQFSTGDRLSLAGYQADGRGGVILDSTGHVSGHKIVPIGDDTEFTHFSFAEASDAIEQLMFGLPVLINGSSGRIGMRWNPLTLEVFGEGRDSYTR